VVEQFQPKQRHVVETDLRCSNHAYLAVPSRGERNRRGRTALRNARKSDVSSRDLQFDECPIGPGPVGQFQNP
jgi:hypothetical protein